MIPNDWNINPPFKSIVSNSPTSTVAKESPRKGSLGPRERISLGMFY